MYKRVMVGVDDNFATNQVLDTALRLCKQLGSKLAICHAIDETIFASQKPKAMMSNRMQGVEERLRTEAMTFLEKAKSMADEAGVDAELLVVCSQEDDVAEMLVKAANEWRANLLVVGENELRGLERYFVDSVGESLLRTSNIPLLVVHAKTPQ